MDRRQKGQIGGRTFEKDISDVKPVIEFCTMSKEQRDECVEKAKEALQSLTDSNTAYYKKVAKMVKLALEEDKNETWNCVVGSDYGAYLSFDKAHLVYFRLNEIYFLIFRFGAGPVNQ